MSAIFISHAVADSPLAALLTDFLKEAVGVPANEIFCSSVPGHEVPLSEDFNAYMKNKIQNPQLVILLMTSSYMESHFCLMELGAAWAKSHRTLPIVVPPVSFENVTKTLGLVQALKITDQAKLIDLRQTVIATDIKLEKRTEQDWEKKRKEWRQKSKKIIDKLAGPTSVPASEHGKTLTKLDTANEEKEDFERQLDEALDTIEGLKNAKDSAEVGDILRKALGNNGLEEEFKQLLDNVDNAFPSAYKAVQIHIIMDYYDKAPRIDWNSYSDEFEDAIQRKLIDQDDGHPVLWNGSKLKNVRKALNAIDQFLDSVEGEKFSNMQDDNVPMETDDRDFWERHLSL